MAATHGQCAGLFLWLHWKHLWGWVRLALIPVLWAVALVPYFLGQASSDTSAPAITQTSEGDNSPNTTIVGDIGRASRNQSPLGTADPVGLTRPETLSMCFISFFEQPPQGA